MDTTTVDMVTQVVSTLGFPVFVAIWSLTKGSKDSADMKQAINDLATVVKVLTEKIDNNKA